MLHFAVRSLHSDPCLLYQGGIRRKESLYLRPFHFRAALAVFLQTFPHLSAHPAQEFLILMVGAPFHHPCVNKVTHRLEYPHIYLLIPRGWLGDSRAQLCKPLVLLCFCFQGTQEGPPALFHVAVLFLVGITVEET